MRTILAAAALILATPAVADTYVNGYYRNDGTYVQPHYRTSPDQNRYNNYSSQGNSNPYTGNQGRIPPGGYIGSTPSNPYGSIGGGLNRNGFR